MSRFNLEANLMVVDDSGFSRTTLRKELRALGFKKVQEAGDAAKALEQMAQGEVALIFCDQVMPGMTGTELLHKVRRNRDWDQVPFVLVTGQVDRTVVAECADYGGDALLVKPYSQAVVEEKINEAVAHRRMALAEQGVEQVEITRLVRNGLESDTGLATTTAKLDPMSPPALVSQGLELIKEGRLDQAEEKLTLAVDSQGSFIKAHEALAQLYALKQDQVMQLNHLERAVKLNPGNLQRRYDLAELMEGMGRREEAGEVLAAIVNERCGYPGLLTRVGTLALKAGMKALSQSAYTQALHSGAQDTQPHVGLAALLQEDGDWQALAELCQKALELDPASQRFARLAETARAKLGGAAAQAPAKG